MSRRILTVVLGAAAIACAAVPVAAGDGGGPSPGLAWGGSGIASPDGQIHYVAVQGRNETIVEAVGTRGSVRTYASLRGSYGIPYVTAGGQVGGLSRDGRRLVVASYPGPGDATLFAVLKTGTLAVARRFRLPGSWAYDALSPDGRTLYLIQYFQGRSTQRYLVRAYDLARGRLYRQVVSDRREAGTMTGFPLTRTTSADGDWVYTLYVKGNGSAFVHALDAADRKAVCVDLPWRKLDTSKPVGLWLSRDGWTLHVRQIAAGRRAAIDIRTWKVTP